MSNLFDDYKKYTDKFGLVQPTPGETSGNGLLYTAQFAAALEDSDRWDSPVWLSYCLAVGGCQIQLGLMARNPENTHGQQGPDDYIGCGLFSDIMGMKLAYYILEYGRNMGGIYYDEALEKPALRKVSKLIYTLLSFGGRRNVKYNYNNINPGYFTLSSWLGRQPQIITHLQFASNENPSILSKVYWCLSLLSTLFIDKKHHDAYILSWCLYRVARGKSRLCDLACNIWKRHFIKTWETPGKLLAAYFVNPDHPSAKYLNNV